MDYPLLKRLPPAQTALTADILLDRFLEYATEASLSLYPAQENAILELYDGKNVILNTPTGSGKSLVATALHFKSVAQGRRSVYTCPIKALVNEKFLALCRDFGPEQVGMMTGDATVNRDAPILCCTAEILANFALRSGADTPVDDVIMDEFHYYSDRDRGVAWQSPLLTLPHVRFLLMSATLGDTSFFEQELTRLTGVETMAVNSSDRPVPLEFSYRETPLELSVEELTAEGKAPIYIVHFTQLECAQNAQSFLSLNFCTREEKAEISKSLEQVKFSSPFGKEIKKLVKHGIGLHHAGLLPKYRVLIEQLARRGLLKIICGTDTLGVGVNVPIRTVLFTKLCKYDGKKSTLLTARDFHQISGRAGRRGYDSHGWVMAQAPEHVIENTRLEQKAGGDAKKLRKVVRRKPPERGYVHWTKDTFLKLIAAPPEPLVSRFTITHGMLLSVLGRPGDGCRAMREIIRHCHETEASKKLLRKRAFQLFRSLVDRKIIEIQPRGGSGPKLRINLELQEDFSLNQTLALYLLDTIQVLDPNDPAYPLDLLSLIEAILENPEVILRRQLDRLKDEKMAEMKAEGREYEERMEELEKLEYPKPNREFIYSTFNAFSAAHPWVGEENIKPKSIAREMFEGYQSFADYIHVYDLQRAEGLLLRHISAVYKVLDQTVPTLAKTDVVLEVIEFFTTMLRQVDSSLLDEWERLRNPDWIPPTEEELPPPPLDITRDRKAFRMLVRAEIYSFLRELGAGRYLESLALLSPDSASEWDAARLDSAFAGFYQEHTRIRLDAPARNVQNTRFDEENPERWKIEQRLVDPEELNDWYVFLEVDLSEARTAGRPLLHLKRVEAML